MNLKHFVRVVVTFSDGSRQLGTGYRISHGRVLTSGHVVDGHREVTCQPNDSKAFPEPIKAEVLWKIAEEDSRDVALLGCSFEDDAFCSSVTLAKGPLAETDSFETRGWALAGLDSSRDLESQLIEVLGRAYGFTENAGMFRIGVEDPPESADAWKGVSGAPVLRGGELYGVIRSGAEFFGANRIEVVPIHLFLQIEAFEQHLEKSSASRWRITRREIEEHLTADDVAARAIADRTPEWSSAYSNRQVPGLMSELCEKCHIVEFLEQVDHACYSLISVGKTAAASTLRRIVNLIIPILYEKDRWQPVLSGQSSFLEVPAATPTVAEIAVATSELRAINVRPGGTEEEDLEPVNLVNSFNGEDGGVECGFNVRGKEAFEDFIGDLCGRYLLKSRRKWLELHLQKLNREDWLREAIRLLQRRLDWLEQSPEGAKQFILCDPEFAAKNGPFLQKVREKLPNIGIVQLSSLDFDADLAIEFPLANMLRRFET